MSAFYGWMKGSKGPTTRQGTKSSGMESHLSGWDIGMYSSTWNSKYDEELVHAAITGGSNDTSHSVCLGVWKRIQGKIVPVDTCAKLIATALGIPEWSFMELETCT